MNRKILSFHIDAAEAGTRLDRCLSRLIPGSSRTYLQKLITEGLVSADGVVLTVPRYPVRAGMTVQVEVPEPESTDPVPEPFDFPILYEDEVMLVIAKPAGVVVHPAAGNRTGTVVNALIGRYPHLTETMADGSNRPGIVHRLDKDTSGCLVIAKTPDAQYKLCSAFASHDIHKTYLAIVRGVPRLQEDEISGLIGRHPVNRQKMAVVTRNGKLAITRYRLEKSGRVNGVPVSLLRVNILTGRTHQIRVHLASIGIPVLGDATYGGVQPEIPEAGRQMLHAWKLKLPHPITRREMEFTAPIPPDFETILNQF